MKPTAKAVMIRPNPELMARLQEMSGLTGIPLNTIACRALAAYLDEVEQWYRKMPKSAATGKKG